MSPDPSNKKSAREATFRGIDAEKGASMDAHEEQDLAQLLRWDELSQAERVRLSRKPSTAAQLEHLRAVDRWLESSPRTAQAGHEPEATASAGPCPPSEELFDYGQGPGFQALRSDRSRKIARHLESCAACGSLVESLQSRPPSPLDLAPLRDLNVPMGDGLDEPEAELAPLHSFEAARSRSLRLPLAAAAVLLAAVGLWQFSSTPTRSSAEVLAALPSGFPQSPLLRGGAAELAFPRGLVLQRATGTLGSWSTSLSFELRPDAAADSYRVEIRRHEPAGPEGSDIFSAGTLVGELNSETPTLACDADLLAALTPGRYTWEAWSLRAGLERRLGARDFEVRANETVWSTLEESADDGTLDSRAVRFLHELGLLTDAQRLAQTLPSSPERDAYLATNLR